MPDDSAVGLRSPRAKKKFRLKRIFSLVFKVVKYLVILFARFEKLSQWYDYAKVWIQDFFS